MITHTVLGTQAQVFLLLCCVFFTAERIYFCKVANFNVMETVNVLCTMYAHNKAQKYKFVLQNLWQTALHRYRQGPHYLEL